MFLFATFWPSAYNLAIQSWLGCRLIGSMTFNIIFAKKQLLNIIIMLYLYHIHVISVWSDIGWVRNLVRICSNYQGFSGSNNTTCAIICRINADLYFMKIDKTFNNRIDIFLYSYQEENTVSECNMSIKNCVHTVLIKHIDHRFWKPKHFQLYSYVQYE